ncbi:MAG: DUF3429 domain-containing protein [Sphingomonadaceae bacterium]|nr:DUF3429 domain-containing protein [Sphingomonadaceae bacterium]
MSSRPRLPRRRRSDAATIPPLSLILGYGPTALLPVLAVASATLPQKPGFGCLLVGQLSAASVLIFIGGVRRGLSFGAPDERLNRQVATALGYFFIGLAAMLVPIGPALVLLILGYALAGLLDRRAARAGEAPPYFATLRPAQAAVAVLGLAGLLARFLLLLSVG